MELFIQIRDGNPHEHPIFGDNFRAAFPDIDPNNLPPEFARFVRTEMPSPDGVYRTVAPNYVWDGNVVTDDWIVRDMTAEEKEKKIAAVHLGKPYPSWVFDEPTCTFHPPIPYPENSNLYDWDEATTSWALIQTA